MWPDTKYRYYRKHIKYIDEISFTGSSHFPRFVLKATLILNWNEDGIIYRQKQQSYNNAVMMNPDSLNDDISLVAPMSLNPFIRGFRLFFVIAFTAFDIGYALYNVSWF